jgi:ribosome-binding factor A
MTVNRIDKVNSLLLKEIGKIIQKDFDFSDCLVTLTHVDVTPNLIDAKAFITVLPDEKKDAIIKILNNNIKDIQQKINKKLNMRPIPKIKFVRDENVKEAAKIEALLEKIKTSNNS